jgi:hypothetical protein
MQTVYFFEKPTIFYCPECDKVDVSYTSRSEVQCCHCNSKDLSEFVWDDNSRHPEQ